MPAYCHLQCFLHDSHTSYKTVHGQRELRGHAAPSLFPQRPLSERTLTTTFLAASLFEAAAWYFCVWMSHPFKQPCHGHPEAHALSKSVFSLFRTSKTVMLTPEPQRNVKLCTVAFPPHGGGGSVPLPISSSFIQQLWALLCFHSCCWNPMPPPPFFFMEQLLLLVVGLKSICYAYKCINFSLNY